MKALDILKNPILIIDANGNRIYKKKDIDEAILELEELYLKQSEYERLHKELNKILHPNGDGPLNPSLCDLISYVKYDLKKLRNLEEIHY